MLGNLKYAVYAVIGIAVVYTLMTNNDGGSDSINRADLDQVLNVASNTLDSFESNADVNKDNAMDKFAGSYAEGLNTSQPAISTSTVGVVSNSDGSFDGFADSNNNAVKDSGEQDLFNLEIDSENNRLIASDETAVRDHGFSGGGLLAGMLIGSMLSRQKAAGKNPSAKKATSKSSYRSARSRAGSGSHSSGK